MAIPYRPAECRTATVRFPARTAGYSIRLGVYKYKLEAEWNGYPAIMPGLPPEGGELYVLDAQPPANSTGMRLLVVDGAAVDASGGVHIIGLSTADKVHFAAVMPGAVLDQGDLTVTRGQFDYY